MAHDSSKWLKKLNSFEGAVTGNYDPHNFVIQSPSPSLNFTFGKGYGLPLGYSMAMGGPPKGGKTLVCYAMAGQCHKDFPDGHVVHFNTEFRSEAQSTPEQRSRIWGIDSDRFHPYEANSPMLIFDRIEQDFAALCQEGWPLKLVIIDSINGIQGRRAMNAESIETQQIGDLALTLGEGFKRILPIQRKYKFAVILTCQIRAEMDIFEQKRTGSKFRMQLPLSVQHYAEYFMYVEPNRNKEGKTDLSGNEFRNEELTDLNGNTDQTGHKIRVRMKDSSCGPKGRLGEFILDYDKGIVSTHEEAFLLGISRGVIERPNNRTYVFGERKWGDKESAVTAFKNDPDMVREVLKEIKRRDQAGMFAADDEKDAAEVAE